MNIAGRTPFRIHLLILSGAVVLSLLPFIDGRFSFLLDFMIGPTWNQIPLRGFGFRTPAYGGSLPLFGLLTALAGMFSVSVVQKVVLFGVLFLLAATAYLTMPGSGQIRLYAGMLMLFNPFVYVRLLAGHWVLLWGLAFLPVVLYTFVEYLEQGSKRMLIGVVLALTLLGFNSHLLFAAGFLIGLLMLSKAFETRSVQPIQRGFAAGLLALPLNAYWLGPTVLGSNVSLSGISSFDLVIFAPRIDSATALLSIATMHGFWRGGYVYAHDLFPPVQLLFVPILFLAVYGFVTNYRDTDCGYVVRAVAATAIIALVLGAGVQGPAAELFRWAFENVPFFAGMRDSQKFVALLVIAYAYLGALGLGELHERIRSRDLGELNLPVLQRGPLDLPSRSFDRGRLLATGIVILAVLTPVAYTFPMATGYAGQVSAQDYPSTWYEVDGYLDDQPGDGAVLFLPWHQYMDYSWLEGRNKRIATPGRAFFTRPVIQGDNVEVEPTYSTSTNPISNYVEFLFGLGPKYEPKTLTNLGELLTHINVKYVLVTKEADWRYYDGTLRDQSDLTLVLENEHFLVYRNDHDLARTYATDRVSVVEDLETFFELSQQEDTTQSVYVLEEDRGRVVTDRSGMGAESIPIDQIHPARYRLGGTDRSFTVFTQHQSTYATTWKYDGTVPATRHLGINPVFTADAKRATVTQATFYRIYLPSYLVSLLTLLGLFGFVFSDSINRWIEVPKRIPSFLRSDER